MATPIRPDPPASWKVKPPHEHTIGPAPGAWLAGVNTYRAYRLPWFPGGGHPQHG